LVLVVPCDAPLLPLDLAQRLLAELKRNQSRAAYAHDGQRAQPAFVLLNANLRTELHDALQSGTRKMETWLTDIGASRVDFFECAPAFANINTADDLIALRDVVKHSR